LPASFLANQLYSARVSANGRFVLATTSGGTSIRYDLATGAAIDLPFPQRPQAISADGRYVAMSGGIRRDVTTGTVLQMTVPPGLTVPGSSIPGEISDDRQRLSFSAIGHCSSLTGCVLCAHGGTVTAETEARLRAASPTARKQAIIDAHNEGASNYAIADVIGMSEAGVRKILKEHHNDNQN
jgi:hypothetical protein